MKKHDLLAMPRLDATRTMMDMAVNDIPQKKKYYGRTYDVYEYELFMRAMVRDGILKVALFLPRLMRLGACRPAYELYIDKAARKFLTYSLEKKKWLTGKLDRIEWEEDYRSAGKRWLSDADAKLISEYLGSETGGYHAILSYQRNIRADELRARHKLETDPWDADLAQVPALPKDWARWVSKVGLPENFIFYQYARGGAKVGYCTYCEKDVPIKRPRHNAEGRCPRCRRRITFKAVGKAGTVRAEGSYIYLLQQCRDGFVIRNFKASRTYRPSAYKTPELFYREYRRTICDPYGHPLRAYCWAVYRQTNLRWVESGLCSANWWDSTRGPVYGKTLPGLCRRGLSRTGLSEYAKAKSRIDPEKYLAVLDRVPQLEQLVKLGLMRMAGECISSYWSFQDTLADQTATQLTRALGVNALELLRLRRSDGGSDFMRWLQYEKAIGKEIPDETISWFCGEKIKPDDLKFIRDRMSMAQIHHYMKRQIAEGGMTSRETLTTWADYLSMAAGFHMDVNDEIVYRARKLRQRHDELAMRSQDKDIAVQAGEVLLKYPHVDDICRSLPAKYNYTGKSYVIAAPACVADVIRDGTRLHICTANSDRYWERIERKESYLLFLRRADEPEVPYYTMEIEPNGTVRQLRTYYDRQHSDIDAAREFLKEWQQVVTERLTDEDRRMADASRTLRTQEFAQMRHDNIVIRTGDLAGHKLVDVLTADLMENAA
ncbi:MAG: hypothetical protein HDT38_03300 [Clostridiales bacterium]|nr:hypothetical protein [Clostridiales bacterium]